MDEFGVLSLLREALWATALMAMPLLISALVVGLIVGLVQALTSIQEMTLTFVPKLAAMLVVMVGLAERWVLARMGVRPA